jgi:hypothetical protein
MAAHPVTSETRRGHLVRVHVTCAASHCSHLIPGHQYINITSAKSRVNWFEIVVVAWMTAGEIAGVSDRMMRRITQTAHATSLPFALDEAHAARLWTNHSAKLSAVRSALT